MTKITRGYIWDTAANPLKPSASGVFGSGMSWQYRARHHVPKDDEHMVRNAIIKNVFGRLVTRLSQPCHGSLMIRGINFKLTWFEYAW